MLTSYRTFIKKYRELLMYLVVGVLTTVVSFVSYYIFASIFEIHYLFSNLLSWVFAVIFAYFTNKLWVFQNYNFQLLNIYKELLSFVIARIATLCIDMAIMFVMVDILAIQDMVAKIVVQFVVIVLNYILSKFLVFKSK